MKLEDVESRVPKKTRWTLAERLGFEAWRLSPDLFGDVGVDINDFEMFNYISA